MKLILQAIKSLLRKLKSEISGLRSGITRLERKQSKTTEDIASLRTDLTKTDYIAKAASVHADVAIGWVHGISGVAGVGWEIGNYDKIREAISNPYGSNSTAILLDSHNRLIPLVDVQGGYAEDGYHPGVFSLITVEDNALMQFKYTLDIDTYPAPESVVYTQTVLMELPATE